jgi:hypothetical protein
MKSNLCPARDKYYVQTNNEDDPLNECQVTSMTAGLDVGNFGLEPILNIVCKYKQPESKLKYYIRNDAVVQNYWKNITTPKSPLNSGLASWCLR